MKTQLILVAAGGFLAACCLGALALLAAENAPRFTGIQALTNKEIALTLSVSNGLALRIDTSSNLTEWAALVTLPGTNLTLQHTDTATPYLSQRFYRAEQLSGTNFLTGDHLATTNGDVVIHPVNHAAFVLRWQDKMIYNDPGNSAARFAGLPRADLILISHSHSDHFNTSVIDTVRGADPLLIVPQDVFGRLTAAQRAIAIVLGYSGSTNVLGLTVTAVPAFNSNHSPLGFGNGYVLTIGGRRLYASGDTGDMAEIRALTNIDVAFVCINLPFTMDVPTAASVVRAFRPQVVYPYHYSPSTPTTDLNDFKRRIGQDLGIEVRLRKWY